MIERERERERESSEQIGAESRNIESRVCRTAEREDRAEKTEQREREREQRG